MVGPARKREAVRLVRRRLGYSERRVCRALGVSRTTARRKPAQSKLNLRLLERILELVRVNPRFGYRRIHALLRREGWKINLKRVHGIWRREGLRVPKRQNKRMRLGSSAQGCIRNRATHRNHVWTLDFAWDVTSEGRQIKFLPIVDEYTRECHALSVGKSIRATDVQDTLERLFEEQGMPKCQGSGNRYHS